ncbi:hypothetical protein AAGF08_02050 [Algoriphagus sp. SE2]|uniref:VPS10 domain-containing protein n=1 Tax=Algoriphagus sp. SE2 TaxID=3141536 RepID=UPI0031CD2716
MRHFTFSIFFLLITVSLVSGQQVESPITKAWESFSKNKSESIYSGLIWDLVGPTINSGRVEAMAVHPDNPSTIYAGFGSGNLWKTTNHGLSWEAIFDNQAGYSIGDISIAPSNENIIYVGTGESLRAKRAHTIPGAGVFRSDDAGKTWKSIGLDGTHHIGRIAVHPTNPDIIFVAALGSFYSPSEERGIYKTENGGESWEKVVYVNDRVGGNDVVFAPRDPSILYASTWYCSEDKAGPGGTIHKSTDGGNTWNVINNGFPAGEMNGRTGLAVSHQDPNKVYAFTDNVNAGYENGSGELYLTLDGGENWKKTHQNNLKILNTFGEVFTDCFVNPQDDNEIYVLGISVLRSTDGGKSFKSLKGTVEHIQPSPANFFHLDHHEMWINPSNPNHIIVGNDGGVYISYDTGSTWMHYNNLPVGEFYFVRTDNDSPYKIYSGTQDDSAVRGPAKSLKNESNDGWDYVWIDPWGGGDGIVVTPDTEDSDIVYYESQNGAIRRKVMSTGETKSIRPRLPKDENLNTLYNEWLTPFFTSSYTPRTLYYGANYMFKSTDRGDSWKVISPDLSRSSDPDRVGNGIIAMEESPNRQGLLYAGTSKGAAWVSKDDGDSWTEISDGIPAKYIKSFAPSKFKESRVYLTQSAIGEDDLNAYVYRSEDFGATWENITSNLPQAPVNVILEDPKYENVLYAGTFNGVFISLNRGDSWHVLGTEIPNSFVSDMTIQERENDLIAVTHGRGIFKFDLEPIHSFLKENPKSASFLYISEAILPQGDGSGKPDFSSYENVNFSFHWPANEKLKLSINNWEGEPVFSKEINAQKGLNTFTWDLILGPNLNDDPYLFNFVNLPKAGEYSIHLTGNQLDIKAEFSIKQPENP